MTTDTAIIWSVGALMAIGVMIPFHLRNRAIQRRTERDEVEALKYGLKEPVTLHPVVDVGECIGTGNCLSRCPEGEVIGFRDGQAYTVSPARCIGHGLCERACPVQAIQLVFGSEKRGVELPRIKANFETNVPGLYVIGELGGMGLIRNAFEQGRQCVDGIRRERRNGPADALDALIVGCGPAGLSASLHCLRNDLSFATVEKEEDTGGAVRYYPRKKLVMTDPIRVPGYGKLRYREILKEDLVDIWQDIISKTGLEIASGEAVSNVNREDGCFTVTTKKGVYRTKRVILAIGRRGVPRKLNVPGEDSTKVAYALREPEAYQNDRILVVGGGDSAVEAALSLAGQAGNQVTISYRRDRFARIKPRNLERIERKVMLGQIKVLWSTNLREIGPDHVLIANGVGDPQHIANDYVFVFAGGQLPTHFLKSCGVRIDTMFGEPQTAHARNG